MGKHVLSLKDALSAGPDSRNAEIVALSANPFLRLYQLGKLARAYRGAGKNTIPTLTRRRLVKLAIELAGEKPKVNELGSGHGVSSSVDEIAFMPPKSGYEVITKAPVEDIPPEPQEPSTHISGELRSVLESGDIELLQTELDKRATFAMEMVGEVGDEDPYGFDQAQRGQHRIVVGATGADWAKIRNTALIVRVRELRDGASQKARLVYVGGIERYDNRYGGGVPPNPSFFTVDLLPYERDGRWYWRCVDRTDSESLGQIPNPYFNARSFSGPFEMARGHSRAYKATDFGTLSVELPDSGDPREITMLEPQTMLDLLIKNALEAIQIQNRIRGLRVVR